MIPTNVECNQSQSSRTVAAGLPRLALLKAGARDLLLYQQEKKEVPFPSSGTRLIFIYGSKAVHLDVSYGRIGDVFL
jgi:hypothetical protein